jgi:hypothetical protein
MKRTLFAFAAVLLVVPAIALGATKSHKVNATALAKTVKVSGNTATVAGIISDKTFGNGAVVYKVIGTGPTQKTTIEVFSEKGTAKGKGTVQVTTNPNGTATFSGKGTITGGTGQFKGATGKFTATGTDDAQGLVTIHAVGKVTF